MEKENFEKLSTNDKWTIVSEYIDLVKTATHNRMSLLPTTSALSAALLVVATFNKDIINMDVDMKIIITVLLVLIPLTLFLYNHDQKNGAKSAKNEIDKLTGESKIKPHGFVSKITAYMPDIIVFIFFSISIVLIIHIWQLIVLVIHN